MQPSPRFQRRSGAVLLLSLLLMASITASTIIVSTLIARSSAQSKNLDNFISASAESDSGLERSLAIVKKGRESYSLESTVAALNTGVPGARFSVAATESSEPIVYSLNADQAINFDILKDSSNYIPTQLRVTGRAIRDATNACVGQCAILEVAWVVISQDGNTEFSGRDYLDTTRYEAGSGSAINLLDVRTSSDNTLRNRSALTGLTPLGFRIRIRPLQGGIRSLKAVPWDSSITDDPGTPDDERDQPISSKIRLTSTGQVDRTQSQKAAELPWQLPASGLFSYVLFTENSIIPSS